MNAMLYFRGGAASAASLEYGLILLWAATYWALVGSILGSMSPWGSLEEAVLTY